MIYKYSDEVYINTDSISEFKYDEDNDRYIIILNNNNKYTLDKSQFYKLLTNINFEGNNGQ